MATMPRKTSRAEDGARPSGLIDKRCSRSGALGYCLAGALLSCAISTRAERIVVEPWVTARLTASDNAGIGLSDVAASDLISDVTAGFRVRAEGARLSLVGSAALESFLYARHTQGNDIVPSVDGCSKS